MNGGSTTVKKRNHGDDSFLDITNRDIFNKLNSMDIVLKSMDDKIISVEKKVDITNGKVKLSRWIATTALALVLGLSGFFFTFIANNGGKP